MRLVPELVARSSVSRRNVLRQVGAGVGLTLAGTALHADPLLKADVETKKLTIAGAYLSLDTGVVSWL